MRRRRTPRARSSRLAVGILTLSALLGAGLVPGTSASAASPGWSSWQSIGGPLSGAPDVASQGTGKVDFFARGTDGRLHHRGYPTSTGSWSAYDDLGAISSDPAATSPSSGRVDVFATFSDRQVHHSTYRSGLGWSGWQTIPGVIAGAPDAASARDGTLNLVARDTANRLILNVANSAGSWSGWQVIGGVLTSDPSAVSRAPGVLDVFARGAGYDLVQYYRLADGWHGKSLGGLLATAPDVASWSSGRVDVFAASTVNRLYQRSWDYASGWDSWHQLTAIITAAPGVVSWGPGRLDLFVRSTNNVLFHSARGASAPVSSGSGIVSLARRYVGVGESPAGSNCTPFAPAGTCLPWCTYFATWVWHHANSALPSLSYSGSVYLWAVANGRWKAGPSRPAPGDIVVYGNSSGATVHTGIVESVGAGTITTIDGNYSDRVSRVGPFNPALATSPARILGYASPVPLSSGASAMMAAEPGRMVMPPVPTLAQIRSQDGGH